MSAPNKQYDPVEVASLSPGEVFRMRDEALAAGFYHSRLLNRRFPKIQILTIRQLLAGERANLPSHAGPPRWRAERFPSPPGGEQLALPNPADANQGRFRQPRKSKAPMAGVVGESEKTNGRRRRPA